MKVNESEQQPVEQGTPPLCRGHGASSGKWAPDDCCLMVVLRRFADGRAKKNNTGARELGDVNDPWSSEKPRQSSSHLQEEEEKR